MWLLFATSASASLCAPGEMDLMDCALDDGGRLAFCAAESPQGSDRSYEQFSIRRSGKDGDVQSLRVTPGQVGRDLEEHGVYLAVNDDSQGLHLEASLAGERVRVMRQDAGWSLSAFQAASNTWSKATACKDPSPTKIPVALRVFPIAHDKALYAHLNARKAALSTCVGYSARRQNARFDVALLANGALGSVSRVRGPQKLVQCARDNLATYLGPKHAGVARIWIHATADRAMSGATGSISNIHRETMAADDLERSVDDSLVLNRCKQHLATSPTVQFQIIIDAEGHVSGRGEVRAPDADEAASTCVAQAITGLRVPAPGRPFSGRGTIKYPSPQRPRLDVSTADM